MQKFIFVLHRKHISAAKTNRLMLFKEIISVYCENHMKHTGTLCGQNAEFCTLKQVVHIDLLDFKGLMREAYGC
jgi:hypothetical protein